MLLFIRSAAAMIRSPLARRGRAWPRASLVAVTVIQAGTGAWQLLLPRSFYDDFPLPEHPWVAMLPAYNEHLMRAVGNDRHVLVSVPPKPLDVTGHPDPTQTPPRLAHQRVRDRRDTPSPRY